MTQEKTFAFDFLRKLSVLKKTELEGHYNSENIKALSMAEKEIFGTEEAFKVDSAPAFAELIFGLAALNKKWNLEFGNVVIVSNEMHEDGKVDGAVRHVDDFIKKCPVAFYIEHARCLRQSLLENPPRKTDPVFKEWALKTAEALADTFDAMRNENSSDREKALVMLDNIIDSCPFDKLKKDALFWKEELRKIVL